MSWSVTLNGTTYTDADFEPWGYVTALPAMMADLAAVAAGIAAAAASGGLFLGAVAINANDAKLTVNDTTSYAANVGGIIDLDFKNASGTQRTGARAETQATTGTNAAEVADFVVSTMRAGTLTEALRVTGAGHLSLPTTSATMAIGGAVSADTGLSLTGLATGATTVYGFYNTRVVQSGVTGSHHSFRSNPSTAAASFTLTSIVHFAAAPVTVGSGSTITNQFGFHAGALTGATSNYGFYGAVAAAANAWNFYAVGTARNYMAGALSIGGTTDPGTGGLYVAGTIALANTTAATAYNAASVTLAGGLGVAGAIIGNSTLKVPGLASFTNFNDFALLVGHDARLTTDNNIGMYWLPYSTGDLYIDYKAYTAGSIIHRCGAGTETGNTRTWMTVTAATGAVTFPETIISAASTTSRAGVRIPSGTAPSSPTAGDFWFDGTNLKFRDAGGTTRTITWT